MFIVGKITHIESGRYYICKTTQKKWDLGYMGSGTVIKALVAKHGRDAFVREVISTHTSEREAYGAEQFEIGLKFGLDPFCINLRGGGLGGSIGYSPTDEIRAKISRLKMGNTGRLGVPHTPESRAKISKALTGKKGTRRGVKLSQETKDKISKANAKAFIMKGKKFNRLQDAAEHFGVTKQTIWRRLKRERNKT